MKIPKLDTSNFIPHFLHVKGMKELITELIAKLKALLLILIKKNFNMKLRRLGQRRPLSNVIFLFPEMGNTRD